MLVRQPSLGLLLKGTTLISPFIVINENHQLLTLGPNAFVLINIVCIFEQQQSFFHKLPLAVIANKSLLLIFNTNYLYV
jgi:hypothetical protein